MSHRQTERKKQPDKMSKQKFDKRLYLTTIYIKNIFHSLNQSFLSICWFFFLPYPIFCVFFCPSILLYVLFISITFLSHMLCLSIHQSIKPFLLSFDLLQAFTICLFVCLSVCLSVFLSVCFVILIFLLNFQMKGLCLYVYLYVYVCVNQSVYLYVYVPTLPL